VKDADLQIDTNIVIVENEAFSRATEVIENSLQGIFDKPEVMEFIFKTWTEIIPSEKVFEQVAFPKMQALSEVCWSQRRDWTSFQMRMKSHFSFMDDQQIKYRHPGWGMITSSRSKSCNPANYHFCRTIRSEPSLLF
jgi:hypothetical protein